MSSLLRKELRLMLPSLMLGMVLIALMPWIGRDSGKAVVVFGVMAVVLAIGPFGHECSFGTFGGLISQPMPRQRIWMVKTLVAAGSVLLLTAAFEWIQTEALGEGIPFIALIALAGGLWASLFFREIIAAFVFTIFMPTLFVVAWATGLPVVLGWLRIPDTPLLQDLEVFGFLGVYTSVAVLWSRRMFLNAEDSRFLDRSLSFPAWGLKTWRASGVEGRGRTTPVLALVNKELRSHQIAFLFAGGLTLAGMASMLLRAFVVTPDSRIGALLDDYFHYGSVAPLLEGLGFLWIGVPLVIGATAIADERKQGTTAAQLCLPVARWREFGIKLLVALLLGSLLGGLLPWVVGSVEDSLLPAVRVTANTIEEHVSWGLLSYDDAPWEDGISLIPDPLNSNGLILHANTANRILVLLAVTAGATFVSFWMSSLSRHVLEALGLALLAVPALGVAAASVLGKAGQTFFSGDEWRMALIPRGPLILWIGGPAVLATIVVLTFLNYRMARIGYRTWLRNITVFASVVALSGVSAAAIFPRPWEQWMAFEPPHAAARWNGQVQPRVCSREEEEGRIVALLPDGRIWSAPRAFKRTTFAFEAPMRSEEGALVSEDKWLDIRCLTPHSPWIISHASDLHAGSRYTLAMPFNDQIIAIRSDGSLFGIQWSGSGSPPVLERLGPDSDWRALVGRDNGHFFIQKKNGPAWAGLRLSRVDYDALPEEGFPAYAINDPASGELYRRRDADLDPTFFRIDRIESRSSDFVDYTRLSPRARVERTIGQELWSARHSYLNFHGPHLENGSIEAPIETGARSLYSGLSRYSDWIAAAQTRYDFVALAADGTFCGWSNSVGDGAMGLSVSRHPLWCSNPFTEKDK